MAVYLTNDIGFDCKEIFISIPELEAMVGNVAVDLVEDVVVSTNRSVLLILMMHVRSGALHYILCIVITGMSMLCLS